ncbi:3-deoxy-D-manno-octulosonic-acid kinase [Salinisphaera shabanensis T35B1]|uniref:3-deoxy-D-manno-octulosonic acid kinase n=1 Tax=Salinisphaera shabanensis TaxID=180542 RepID=UPI00333F1765
MTLQTTRGDNGDRIVWNDAVLDEARSSLFDPAWWRSRGALLGEAQGRGAAYFLDGLDGSEWVLRHNRRGGALARWNHDHFLYTGAERARPIRELRLIAHLDALELPVPEPVAARVTPRLGLYRGDVITRRIAAAHPLADRLARQALPSAAWQRLGAVLARFHHAGVWHADLNARNVLVDADDAFHLIDFDKACLRTPGKWREANLARFYRSLAKFRDASLAFNFLEADWSALRGGYVSASAAAL